MELEYLKISYLEDLLSVASSEIKKDEWSFNHILACEFNVNLINSEIAEATDDAKLWAAKECPPELYINHGSFIEDGMEHIIKELKGKPSSNRALFSLISQKNISNKGDDPIPSFMILQASIDSSILYCTAYFRALEVSTFLRINIEEIRLKLNMIYKEAPSFSVVRLVIFAFRGYNEPCINTLKKAKLDLMSDIDIFLTLKERPFQLHDLIIEKAKKSTVIDLKSLYVLKESLEKMTKNIDSLKKDYVISLLSESLRKGEELKIWRTKHSHHDSLENTKREFTLSLEKLACEFEKCPCP